MILMRLVIKSHGLIGRFLEVKVSGLFMSIPLNSLLTFHLLRQPCQHFYRLRFKHLQHLRKLAPAMVQLSSLQVFLALKK